ncbi:hypothetical protein CALVIDRAFT_132006 [Calocera viscosa TUFC12733]|uniref:PH domain-containing protein n=1 Tax=Calocera viscosa (strain TUFC12733) TaxID=1330018 RepID=A0A167RV94_CALVF|nr:hypothetical protein CALVIDRAFT_132006 [Calocera viscosa TUFC12733]
MQSTLPIPRPPHTLHPPNMSASLSRSSTRSGASDYRTPAETAENGDDDDVPLAKGIPTALQAQKSIRISARASSRRPPKLKSTSVPLPLKADDRHGKTPKPPSPGLPPEELMRKLMELQLKKEQPAAGRGASVPMNKPTSQAPAGSAFTSIAMPPLASPTSRGPASAPIMQRSRDAPPAYTAKPTSPSHPSSVAQGARILHAGPPTLTSQRASGTSSGAVSRSGTSHRQQRRASDEASTDNLDAGGNRDLSSQPPSRSNTRHVPSQRREPAMSSADAARRETTRQPERHSDPPQPEVLFTVNVYLFDLQRSVKLDVDASTTARSALDSIVKQRGAITGDVSRLNELSLWELANDFGMERPIRDFELLRKVCEAWDMQRPLNAFMVKYWGLTSLLSRKAVPSRAPTAQSDVNWQVKPGKWSKRHLHLHEGNFYLSKSGKEEPFLCSVNNHDFYMVTRIHKAPKAFIFAIKSTDNIVFYENPEESLHVFAVGQVEGERWMEQILLARSAVLVREMQLSPVPSSANPSQGAEAQMMARARTVRQAAAVTTLAPTGPTRSGNPFQAGTLLGLLARKG